MATQDFSDNFSAEFDTLKNIAPVLDQAAQSIKDLGKEITALNQNLQKDFSDSIKSAIKNGTDFTGIFEKLRGTLEDFVIQVGVVNPALNALFGGNRGTLGDIGGDSFDGSRGLFGALFSGITNLLEGRAAGGPVSPGTPYIVGERGPELFVPQTAGRIASSVGAAVNITMNISASDASSFRSSQAQIAAQMVDAVRRAQRIR
jgi:phage-related minor tail protein